MAGIIKLNGKDICSSEGQTITVGLQKCLDPNSSVLIKVDRVWTSKISKAKSTMGDLSARKKFAAEDTNNKRLKPTVIDNYRN
jgi:hypothetical protein